MAGDRPRAARRRPASRRASASYPGPALAGTTDPARQLRHACQGMRLAAAGQLGVRRSATCSPGCRSAAPLAYWHFRRVLARIGGKRAVEGGRSSAVPARARTRSPETWPVRMPLQRRPGRTRRRQRDAGGNRGRADSRRRPGGQVWCQRGSAERPAVRHIAGIACASAKELRMPAGLARRAVGASLDPPSQASAITSREA